MESTALSAVCAGRKGRVRLVGFSACPAPPRMSQKGSPHCVDLGVWLQKLLGKGRVIYFDKGRPRVMYAER